MNLRSIFNLSVEVYKVKEYLVVLLKTVFYDYVLCCFLSFYVKFLIVDRILNILDIVDKVVGYFGIIVSFGELRREGRFFEVDGNGNSLV